jgi:N-acetylneuraminic acid mutarotase
VAGALLILLFGAVPRADAQTLTLTVHVTGDTSGTVRVIAGGFGVCTTLTPTCTVYVDTGATVRLSAAGPQPGRFSGGTGPAAACALSTCSFTMTSAADLNVAFTSGDGPVATITTTIGGNGGSGTASADGILCTSGSCTTTYLQGSTVQLQARADAYSRGGLSAGTGAAAACLSNPCSFTLSGDGTITAYFEHLMHFDFVGPGSVTLAVGGSQLFQAYGTYGPFFLPGIVIQPGFGNWSAAPPLPSQRQQLAAAAFGGKVYAVGGDVLGPGNFMTAFDPAGHTWTEKAPMLEARAAHAAAVAGNALYAIGGSTLDTQATASVERYDPSVNAWAPRASMSAGRRGLVAGTVNGVIYAAGGSDSSGTAVSTLEAYDPATDSWALEAPMPTARTGVMGGAIDGIFYVAGGANATTVFSTVEAYDPATNTWTTKAPMPAPLAGGASVVADGVLYVMRGQQSLSVVYAYDPVANTWSLKAPMRTGRWGLAAAELDGIVYALGGVTGDDVGISTAIVETYVDSLRWSSSAPSVARITQQGLATAVGVGIAVITARVGAQTCTECPALLSGVVLPPSTLSLDVPANGTSMVESSELTIAGWALNTGVPTGTGVDQVFVDATSPTHNEVFLGYAQYGVARPDVGAIFGSRFTNSGFTLTKAGFSLAPGQWTISVSARNALTHSFDVVKTTNITVTAAPAVPFIAVDTPTPGAIVTSAFEVGGWAIDLSGQFGTGVDQVRFYVQPEGQPAPGVLIGTGSYGIARPDVGAVFGSRYTNSGFHFTITGLGPGSFTLNVHARRNLTGEFSIVKSVPFTVNATALMSIDVPTAEATILTSTFTVDGWSIDRTVESTAIPGSGVDALHVYAYPNPGSGTPPIFLGVATVGISRPDVGAVYGARYDTSGYHLFVDRNALGLTDGVYNIAVASHSQVTGTFNAIAVVRVMLVTLY